MNSSKIAANLIKIKAIKIRLEPPFSWSSGWKSPIYCDNRKTLSFPEIRKEIRDQFAEKISTDFPEVDGIAGVATGAIAHGVLVAEALNLPFIYIRSKAKGHGMNNLIEGELVEGNKYVVIEDLISTGKSSVQAVKAVQEAGGVVLGTLSIFTYGFPHAYKEFEQTGTQYQSLVELSDLLPLAEQENYLKEKDKEILLEWQKNPENWGQK